jgi:hypothetical protein
MTLVKLTYAMETMSGRDLVEFPVEQILDGGDRGRPVARSVEPS